MKTILKVLVGSHAHGLANEKSDKDFRGVYIIPTEEFLNLSGQPKMTSWIEGEEDNTSYEIKKFLTDAIAGLPNTIEMFFAPIVEATEEGRELLNLFPHIWDKQLVFNSFTGYAENNLKKMLENKDNRPKKYAGFIIRVLINLNRLLATNNIDINYNCSGYTDILKDLKNPEKELNYGLIVNEMKRLTGFAQAYLKHSTQKPDYNKVNEFLLRIRKNNL